MISMYWSTSHFQFEFRTKFYCIGQLDPLNASLSWMIKPFSSEGYFAEAVLYPKLLILKRKWDGAFLLWHEHDSEWHESLSEIATALIGSKIVVPQWWNPDVKFDFDEVARDFEYYKNNIEPISSIPEMGD